MKELTTDHSDSSSLPSVMGELQETDLVCSIFGYICQRNFRRFISTAIVDDDNFIREFWILGLLEGGKEKDDKEEEEEEE